MSITQKMLLIFIGCVILPLAIQNFFYFRNAEVNIQRDMMQRLTLSLTEKADKINGSIAGVINLSNRYNTNEELYGLVDKSYSSERDFFIIYQDQIEKMLFSDLAYNRQIRKMTLYTDNPTVLNGALMNKLLAWDTKTLGENLLDQKLISLSPGENGPYLRISLIPVKTQNLYDRSLSVIRPLRNYIQYNQYNKALRIDIDTSYLSATLQENELFDNIILVDPDHRIIASANTYKEFGSYEIFQEDKLKEGIVLLKQPLGDMPLTLYGLYDSRMISEEFSKMRGRTTMVALVSMLLAVIFIYLIAGNITRRTRLVVIQSKQIAQGNFTQIENGEMGRDEIGALSDSMNHMSMQLKTLIEEKYKNQLVKAQLERETAQAKLLALQSQVNPHFMFNALECIRMKASVNHELETAQMIKYMSRMFRHIINWEDDIILLQQDMKFLDEFLKIQRYRFDDEFEFAVRVDEAARECLLPKMIIQPLVENACVHGVEAISHKRFVEISAVVKDNRLVVTVSDNGMGMSKERLEELDRMLKKGTKLSESVGLFNVHQRLILYYGKEFSFTVRSQYGSGTEVRLDIPARYERDDFSTINAADG